MKKLLAILLCVLMVFALVGCDKYIITIGDYQITIGGNGKDSSSDEGEIIVEFGSTSNGGNGATSNGGNNAGNAGTSNGGNTGTSNGGNTGTSNGGNTGTSNGGNAGDNGGSNPSGTVNNANYVSHTAVSEGANIIWKDTAVSSAKVYYKKSGSSSYTQIDNELISTPTSGQGRADIVGISAGTYDFRVDVGSANDDIEITGVKVGAYDRSGYAHFNYTSGIGAYKDDGTLKSDAIVVYVNESNKNSVSGNGKTGLANIIKNANSKPVCVRIIGRINADTLNSSGKYEGKYTQLNGLTNSNKSDDTYYNMLDVPDCKNITIEGIGSTAEFFQWGLTFKRCNSIEVRNITFTDYPEDACAFEGKDGSESSYGNYWIHNNQFNIGKNNYDVTSEQDKHYGDGATDIKYCHNVTFSYNKYVKCQKTGLIGGSDSNLQYNITSHHNWYSQCKSRTPLGRTGNMHYYNNYFDSATGTVMSIRSTGYMFSESNYYYKCSKPFEIKNSAKIKSYGDKFDGCSSSGSNVVTDRTATVSNSCKINGTSYSTFDTNASLFYYDSSAKASKVSYLTDAATAKTDCSAASGVNKANKGV